MRKPMKSKTLSLLIIIALMPGCLTLLYSQTFIYVGFGATDWWWAGLTTPIYNVSLSVSNLTPVATETLHGEQITIGGFNITGGNVTISVSCETNATIASYESVSGWYDVSLKYPTADPTGNYDQDYNVTVLWVDSNATVTFDCVFTDAIHSDGSVTYILPGYEEIRVLGEILLIYGLAITGIIVVMGIITIHLDKQRTSNQ